jgi:hypothetical protein
VQNSSFLTNAEFSGGFGHAAAQLVVAEQPGVVADGAVVCSAVVAGAVVAAAVVYTAPMQR